MAMNYGSNITNFNPQDVAQKRLAELGQLWREATTPEQRTQYAQEGAKLRESLGVGATTFDPTTGVTTFNTTPTSPFAGNEAEARRLAEQAVGQRISEATSSIQSFMDRLASSREKGIRSAELMAEQQRQALKEQQFLAGRQAGQRMAGRGLTGSGLAEEAQTRVALAGQQQLSQLYSQLGQQKFSIDEQYRLAQEEKARELQNLEANRSVLTEQEFQNQLDRINARTAQTLNTMFQEAQLTGQYQGRPTMAQQQLDLQDRNTMAQLTGTIVNDKGETVKTTAQQQTELQNLWNQAQLMGSVSPELSKLTGIPAGTPTFQAAQAKMDQQLATVAQDQQKVSDYIALWKGLGEAPYDYVLPGNQRITKGTPYGGQTEAGTNTELANTLSPLYEAIELNKKDPKQGLTPEQAIARINSFESANPTLASQARQALINSSYGDSLKGKIDPNTGQAISFTPTRENIMSKLDKVENYVEVLKTSPLTISEAFLKKIVGEENFNKFDLIADKFGKMDEYIYNPQKGTITEEIAKKIFVDERLKTDKEILDSGTYKILSLKEWNQLPEEAKIFYTYNNKTKKYELK